MIKKKVAKKKVVAKKKKVAAPAVVKKPTFPIVVFDTETTGLTKNRTVRLDKQPEVIEFYARLVDLDAGPEPLQELYTLIRPSVEYPMSAYTIRETKTKISNDELKDAPVFGEVADAIHDFICDGSPGNLAHNLSFDRDMIEIELERLGRKIVWPLVGICTVEQTIHLRGRRMNQTALHQYLFEGKDFPGAHRARNDVEALTNIAVELHRRGVI
jgi:DNA polymerase III epsilon subunit-like protein